MLYYALMFLVVGLIAGALGLFGHRGDCVPDLLDLIPRRHHPAGCPPRHGARSVPNAVRTGAGSEAIRAIARGVSRPLEAAPSGSTTPLAPRGTLL